MRLLLISETVSPTSLPRGIRYYGRTPWSIVPFLEAQRYLVGCKRAECAPIGTKISMPVRGANAAFEVRASGPEGKKSLLALTS
ncbi:hypothetical protein GGS21DRAFT_97037 [Xylaria nigripes]|nr:hypothetical protein GGS21DRAFT_97037 [Xylaria nigripes]